MALVGAIILISLAVLNQWLSQSPLAEASQLSLRSANLASTNLRNAEVIQALGMLPALRHRWFGLHERFLNFQRIANAQIDSLKQQFYTTLATEARLLAEQQGEGTIVFPTTLLTSQSESRIHDILTLQKQLFLSRREMLRSDLAGMQQAEEGINFQIKGLREALMSKQQQALLKEQVANLRPLTEEGYFPRNRYLELLSNQSELSGSMAEMAGRMGQIEKQRQEMQQRVIQRQADYQREVRTQLADV
ncbi:hypothetical protein XNA1_550015 [Xenorhabdus nematophila str. Anatoliense]|nr:hypothetical protein XNA1_2330015 [Xenorhabdus nematophila str. Anatoliense]CEE95552.1 hypothetical protein XNA1_550015 [Xenorhabdus nematophila str. Anatoliense]